MERLAWQFGTTGQKAEAEYHHGQNAAGVSKFKNVAVVCYVLPVGNKLSSGCRSVPYALKIIPFTCTRYLAILIQQLQECRVDLCFQNLNLSSPELRDHSQLTSFHLRLATGRCRWSQQQSPDSAQCCPQP